jgi:hypothetical protein
VTKSRRSGDYEVIGTTSDGVRILAPKTKATHFTARQIRRTIAELRKEDQAKNT